MQLQAGLIIFEIIILNSNYENEEIIKKGVPKSAKNLQARMIFLKVSKPAGIEWGTAFLRNSS